MPVFKLNKLVRDRFKEIYKDVGQKPNFLSLSDTEHRQQLVNKITEEVNEIDINGSNDDIIDEIADITQVLEDLMTLCGIQEQQVQSVKRKVFNKKGGFIEGTFLDTLELKDDDPWVEYYRKRPDLFPEIK